MRIDLPRLNIYLSRPEPRAVPARSPHLLEDRRPLTKCALLALSLLLAGGCSSPEQRRKKEYSAVRVHLEAPAAPASRSQPVPVYRAKPVFINVENAPFLSEHNVKAAAVIDVPGGFDLKLELDRRGTWLLEQYSSGNPSRRLVIFAQFASVTIPGQIEARWLAAIKLTHRITDGVLTFTPDATREEAEQIALGLNNTARKLNIGKEFGDQ
jgi:hypothetical protein